MTYEEQNKRWAELSDESKQARINAYNELLEMNSNSTLWTYNFALYDLEELYGKHNLQPHVITYGELMKELFKKGAYNPIGYNSEFEFKTTYPCNSALNCQTIEQTEKLKAINMLLNVAKHLNKNELGDVWMPDWKNIEEPKWTIRIEWDEEGNEIVKVGHYLGTNGHCNNSIVYFRTKEIAEQAIQILGEEVIKTCLMTEY